MSDWHHHIAHDQPMGTTRSLGYKRSEAVTGLAPTEEMPITPALTGRKVNAWRRASGNSRW